LPSSWCVCVEKCISNGTVVFTASIVVRIQQPRWTRCQGRGARGRARTVIPTQEWAVWRWGHDGATAGAWVAARPPGDGTARASVFGGGRTPWSAGVLGSERKTLLRRQTRMKRGAVDDHGFSKRLRGSSWDFARPRRVAPGMPSSRRETGAVVGGHTSAGCG